VKDGVCPKSRQARWDVEVVQSEQLQMKSIAGAGLAAEPAARTRTATPNSFLNIGILLKNVVDHPPSMRIRV
jgi:hypothetical protein